ncbi:hypothetical protein CcI49_09335 [Frankia sp. CcI49]|uniref:ATP-binding protein n=1 Tax=Frankia sp. CcI49 TaxID=1745382 RepID=UPI000976702E|nr:LuxR C-terminal-related transcriptional regulator [Frankia sp. CcI49]ONH60791.1 hypothetical protein CcI49_09335 [Frankia sp. CcI49]
MPLRPLNPALPGERTSFVGRGSELTELRRLLGRHRLVTVTGPGGVGKSRLALRAAAKAQRTYPGGVHVVELGELHDPDLLVPTVAAALDCRPRDGASDMEALSEHLASRQLLLVLDNCEHLVAACAHLADELMGRCPDLRLAVTSRESLRIPGEATYLVKPFDVAQEHAPGRAAERDAMMLFLERAQSVRSDFELTDGNRAAVWEICRRLEGMPLPIELAAMRTRALSPAEILAHLATGTGTGTGTSTRILRQDGRGVTTVRQSSPQACAGWSYDLCTGPERQLWARLSVFAGGFDLDAAAGVVAAGGLGEPPLELVFTLVDKSVLTFEPGPERGRLRLPEMYREYGQDRLTEQGETEALRRRHRDWFSAVVSQARDEGAGAGWSRWLSRLRRDHANLDRALGYCAAAGDGDAGLELATSLHRYWVADGRFAEGQRWLTTFVDQTEGEGPGRLQALHTAGWLAAMRGDITSAERLRLDAARLSAREGKGGGQALITQLDGLGALYAGRPGAIEALKPALAQFRRDGELDHLQETLSLLMLAVAFGADSGDAEDYHREWTTIAAALDEPRLRSYADWAYSIATWKAGDARRAREIARATLADGHGSLDRLGIVLLLEAAAWFESSLDEHATAALLFGAADSLWKRMGTSTTALPGLFRCRQRAEATARQALGRRAFETAWARGAVLELEEACAHAVSGRSPIVAVPAVTSGSAPTVTAPLTARERQVADLLARGLSNREIADTLKVSPRTAEAHVQQILNKLGLPTRARVAAWLADHRP